MNVEAAQMACRVGIIHLPHTFDIVTLDDTGCVEGVLKIACGGSGIIYDLSPQVKGRSNFNPNDHSASCDITRGGPCSCPTGDPRRNG